MKCLTIAAVAALSLLASPAMAWDMSTLKSDIYTMMEQCKAETDGSPKAIADCLAEMKVAAEEMVALMMPYAYGPKANGSPEQLMAMAIISQCGDENPGAVPGMLAVADFRDCLRVKFKENGL